MTMASGALARLIMYFAVHPDATPHVRELRRSTGLPPRSLQVELARLERLGVLDRHVDGRLVKYVLNEGNPRWRALRGLVRELADPVDVIQAALADLPGIDAAFLYGSLARGDARPDSDIDVFVLSDQVSEDLLARRTLDAGVAIGREINVITMSAHELVHRAQQGSGFARQVLREPRRWVMGNERMLQSASKRAGSCQ